jgi:superfamily I DNA and RNA helicase
MKTVITSSEHINAFVKRVLGYFNEMASKNSYSDTDAVVYFGFPKFHGYEDVSISPDLLFLSRYHGILILKLYDNHSDIDSEVIEDELEEVHSLLFSKLYESKPLRYRKKRVQNLKFPLEVFGFTDIKDLGEGFKEILLNCNEDINQELSGMLLETPLSIEDFNECRAVLEGTKALSSQESREIEENDDSSKAFILSKLEDEIKNFDFDQRASAVSIIDGPQRIRGLAGSGKTVVLAMKAAHLHLNEPNKKILFTFYTKSLYDHVKNLITRFYRHFKKEDPNWEMLQIKHAWGGSGVDGVYYSACIDNGIATIRFKEAKAIKPSEPFGYVCEDLLNNKSKLRAIYDYVLMDEAQDMPISFFKLVYQLTQGERDHKNIIWGYDELQNIFKVKTRSPKELFGTDGDGIDFVDLDRSAKHIPNYLENDIVLKKCYRNPREVLLVAHALGFGLYKEDSTPVQGLEDKEHWEDLGYEVKEGNFKIGTKVVVERPEKNSPLSIQRYGISEDIIKYYQAKSMQSEVEWVKENICEFIEQGLKPQDIMVIALDDRRARDYFNHLSLSLSNLGIKSNNVLLNPYNSTAFIKKDFVTLSTIHRAKGNEAAAVLVVGIDALHYTRNSRFSRNKIFTAFTRAKAWLRVSGVASAAKYFFEEIDRARINFPNLEFIQHDPQEIDTIQRDLSDKKKELKNIKESFAKQLELLNLTDEEKDEFFKETLNDSK